jgi:hypothetical protein
VIDTKSRLHPDAWTVLCTGRAVGFLALFYTQFFALIESQWVDY